MARFTSGTSIRDLLRSIETIALGFWAAALSGMKEFIENIQSETFARSAHIAS